MSRRQPVAVARLTVMVGGFAFLTAPTTSESDAYHLNVLTRSTTAPL